MKKGAELVLNLYQRLSGESVRVEYHGTGNRLAPAVHFSKTKNRLLQAARACNLPARRERRSVSGRGTSPSPASRCSTRLRRIEQGTMQKERV